MLTVNSRPRTVCNGLARRELLQIGGAGLLGVSLPRLLAAEEVVAASRRARSVIFLFLFGGPSQLETFDLKPDAPSRIRGPYKPIDSRTPGLLISEKLPRLAAMSDKYCVVRTVTHKQNDHNACHYIQTGHPMPPAERGAAGVNATDRDWPAMGSVIEYLSRDAQGIPTTDFPQYVYLPNRLGHLQGYDRSGQYAGWLGKNYDALATDVRPLDKTDPYARPCTEEELDFRIKGLVSKDEMSLERLDARRTLLEQFSDEQRRLERQGAAATYDRFRQRAFDLVSSEKFRSAFDIRRESAELRDRYGRHLFGQSTLVGRRMIEAGARFVTVLWDAPGGYSWDSHINNVELEGFLLPGFDQAFSALLEDLDQRGLLDETLVVAMGEMGRSPQATGAWGRGHWSFAFPAVLAGAGIRGGTVYGRTDKDAAWPADRPVSPEDLAATIFHALGIPEETRLMDAQGRPTPLVEGGEPLVELFG